MKALDRRFLNPGAGAGAGAVAGCNSLLTRAMFYRELSQENPLRLTPGPFEVSERVLLAGRKAIVGHRTDVFRGIMHENAELLLEAFEIPRGAGYFPVVITGTGSAAMEAMVASTVPDRVPLALVNGRFSRRLADMALIHNPLTGVLDFGPGNAIDVEATRRKLDEDPKVDLLLFGVQDTRDCILNPLAALCDLAKSRGVMTCVDSISAGVAEEVFAAGRGIDFFTESSGKCIRGLPGLGIVCGQIARLEQLSSVRPRVYYLNLYEHYRCQKDRSEPRFAPAVPLHFALNEALLELLEEGVVQRRNTIWRRTEYVRRRLNNNQGLRPLLPLLSMPHSVTSYLLPQGVTFESLAEELQRRGILVYSGSSVQRDCFQVGTGGYVTDELLEAAVDSIHEALHAVS